MDTVNTDQSARLQRILQIAGALVALVIIAVSAAVLVRHVDSTSGTVVPAATQAAPFAHGLNGDSAGGYDTSVGGTSHGLNADSAGGYDTSVGGTSHGLNADSGSGY